MDYSILWQMENKSSHRSQSHEGEGGGRKTGMIPRGSIPEHPWDGTDQLPTELSAPRKKIKNSFKREKKKKKRTTNKLNGKIQQWIISGWKSKAAI